MTRGGLEGVMAREAGVASFEREHHLQPFLDEERRRSLGGAGRSPAPGGEWSSAWGSGIINVAQAGCPHGEFAGGVPLAVSHDVIGEIEGQVCWAAWKGHGSVIFLDFGEPTLHIGDRISPRLGRFATVEGTWVICVEYASWRIKMCDELLAADESSDRRIGRALRALRGQVFLGHEKRQGADVLEFDLGGRIEVRRYRDMKTWPLGETCLWYARRRERYSQSWYADGTVRSKD